MTLAPVSSVRSSLGCQAEKLLVVGELDGAVEAGESAASTLDDELSAGAELDDKLATVLGASLATDAELDLAVTLADDEPSLSGPTTCAEYHSRYESWCSAELTDLL